MSYRTLLVPTDFSEHARAALGQAIELAKLCSAKLAVLHSTWIDLPTTMNLSMTRPDLWPPEFLDRVQSGARAQLEAIEKVAAQSGVPCELHQSTGHPVTAILETAQRLPADLIVMGTRGKTGLQHAILGSVAERVVRLAPCPVLTVKAQAHPAAAPR